MSAREECEQRDVVAAQHREGELVVRRATRFHAEDETQYFHWLAQVAWLEAVSGRAATVSPGAADVNGNGLMV